MLEFVDRQEEERMLAISARTGEFLVDNFEREGSPNGTGFTPSEMERINNCSDFIILVHNHSHNGRPSGQDILTYLKEEKVRISIIICHDGTMYEIERVSPVYEMLFEQALQHRKEQISDERKAKILATTDMYLLNDRLTEKHKIFTIRRFADDER